MLLKIQTFVVLRSEQKINTRIYREKILRKVLIFYLA
jgi:hypothetical protein